MMLFSAPRPVTGGPLPFQMAMQPLHKPAASFCFGWRVECLNSAFSTKLINQKKITNGPHILCCSNTTTPLSSPPPPPPPPPPSSSSSSSAVGMKEATAAPLKKQRKRYRKQYPGESKGITEEMRFVAMKLRNTKGVTATTDDDEKLSPDGAGGDTWQPSTEGFLKYLVDSKLIFDTVERIVDESDHVAYAYFRRTGLERSQVLTRDIEWLCQKGMMVPPPSTPGVSYAKYLEELARKSAPLFLCHFYNIYFSHIAGGQVIAKQVSGELLEGRELEFYRWEEDMPELLKGMREKLNMLGEVNG